MRDLTTLDHYRVTTGPVIKLYGNAGDSLGGAFRMKSPKDGQEIFAIAGSRLGWDHVSISRPDRCPDWAEMCFLHQIFFKDDEVAMQLHVPATDHINIHSHCLHLWRPHDTDIPLPPADMV